MDKNGVPFWKASACGNDFLIVEGTLAPVQMEEFTRGICDRNNGVGADGVEWIYASPDANAKSAGGAGAEGFDIRARLINADGSHAEVSGNGTRCVAAWYVARHNAKRVRVATDAGVKSCEVTGQHGREYTFRTAMGKAEILAQVDVQIAGKTMRAVELNVGNPQFVIFVDEFPSAWQTLAAEIQSNATQFPQGVNVEFVKVLSKAEIAIRIFERGAGETMSSGTGSCASAVAAMVAKGLERRLNVHAPGGSQVVEWNSEMFLNGPARLICRGEFFV